MDNESVPGADGFGDSPEGLGESQEIQESSEGQAGPEDEAAPQQMDQAWSDDTADHVPGYAQPPAMDYAPQPAPWEQPQYAPPPQGMEQVDWRLLNRDYVTAIQQGIHGKYDAMYRSATTQQEQALIQRAYAADIREVQLREREALAARRDWVAQQREQQAQAQALPMLRQQAAETLAKKHKLSVEEVLNDRHGRPIWDPHVMELLAQERAYQKWGGRVQQRQASGADRGYATSGGATGSDDVSSMGEKEWAAFKDKVRRTGGRALTG